MKILLNYNWLNGLLLIICTVFFCIDLGNNDIISALGHGFVVIFNMFLILVINQRRIISKLEDDELNKKGE